MTFNFKTRFLIPQCALSAALLCCVLAGTALAEEIRLSATVDKNQLTLEDTVELSLTVHGANNPSVPNLPPLPNFRVRSAGTQSSIATLPAMLASAERVGISDRDAAVRLVGSLDLGLVLIDPLLRKGGGRSLCSGDFMSLSAGTAIQKQKS